MRDVRLQQIDDALVIERGWYPHESRCFDDGLLLVRAGRWPEEPGKEPWLMASLDHGATWGEYARPAEGRDHAVALGSFQRVDGSIFGWTHMDAGAGELKYPPRPGQPVVYGIRRAPSLDALLNGQYATDYVRMTLPYMVPRVCDDHKATYGPIRGGKVVETEHGHLLQGVFALFEYGRVPLLYPERPPSYQWRTCLIYSQDDGLLWHYLSTVASPDKAPLPPLAEGYGEPDLLYFGNGKLLCVMRTGGNPRRGGSMERYTPLMACASHDGGLSWDAPRQIAPYGVAPYLLRMRSGLVVCLSGRPGFFLLFSDDEGATWSTPHWVTDYHADWGRCPSGYGSLVEQEPGVLGVAYDDVMTRGNDVITVTKFCRYHVAGV